ncbi:MAG: FtsX-like permease family protein [Turicibacter sp.]|nr:FtsX-like permease family protein [Turicibacter sp.]
MNIFRRSATYILRNRWKSTLLGTIVLLLSGLVMTAAVMKSAIAQTESLIWSQIPAVASVGWDFSMAMELNEAGYEGVWTEGLRTKELREIGKLPQVTSFDYSIMHRLWSDELDYFFMVDFNFPLGMPGETMSFWATGIHDLEVLEVQQGVIRLVEGETLALADISSSNTPTLISHDFALHNDLVIGSVINFEDRVYSDSIHHGSGNWANRDYIEETKSVKMEVVGIFEVLSEPYTAIGLEMDALWVQQLKNQFFVPISALEELPTFLSEDYERVIDGNEVRNVFVLDDARNLEAFVENANEILSGAWHMENLTGNFSVLRTSLETMREISELMFMGGLLLIFLVIGFTILSFLYDRKSEVGLYRALGLSKKQIISQVLIETHLISLPPLIVSIFIGFLLSYQFSEYLLKRNLLTSFESGNYNFTVNPNLIWFNPGGASLEEMASYFKISLDATTLGITTAGVILTICFSTLFSLGWVLRKNPKEILA